MQVKQKSFDIKFNEIENIIERPFEQVLPDSMMPYSEYVIMDRALPRVEDGLKPVQRRILYTMYDLNMKPQGSYKKSARVVGECLGKYHPHGDKSVYDAMVRMAQDFNMRNTLVDGHGNFGSIDGDSAAAMRYTEVKLQPLAMELLKDIDKGTVPWVKNFDDSLEEPDILPGRFPNLLVNGATGIAIGLATNIPPHNLTEVIDGCIAMIERPSIKLEELVKIIKGPDFPTGGFMVGDDSILKMYETGHGKVVMRAKVDIENVGDRQNIVITEIPYNVNKETLQKRIYTLREQQKEILGNITEVADESDRNGMRIVIKLRKGEDAVAVLNYLIKRTDLECNFNVNIVAIAGGKPRQMGLIDILKYYLDYQRNVVLKRSQHELNISKKREHILDGLCLALPAIDEVIEIIRNSTSRTDSKTKLRERFELSEPQVEAVLNLQLGNINRLDVTKFEKELAELKIRIVELTNIVGSMREQYKIVREELEEIRDTYKVKRLTTIIDSLEDIEVKPFDPTKRASRRGILAIDKNGYVKFLSNRNYVSVNRDVESSTLDGLTVDMLQIEPDNQTLIFGSLGNCYRADAEIIKEKRWTDEGSPLSVLYPSAPADERAVFLLSANPDEDGEREVYIYTEQGYVKKSLLNNYIVNRDFYQVMTLRDGDSVIGGGLEQPNASIMFVTSDGQCINTLTDEYPTQGRIAGGVIGANLNDNAKVVYAGMTTVESEPADDGLAYYPMGEIVVITAKGVGKKVIARDFEPMKRNRKGVRIIELSGKDSVIFATKVLDPIEIAIIDKDNNITALDTENIRIDNRTSKGRPLAYGVKISKIMAHIEDI